MLVDIGEGILNLRFCSLVYNVSFFFVYFHDFFSFQHFDYDASMSCFLSICSV